MLSRQFQANAYGERKDELRVVELQHLAFSCDERGYLIRLQHIQSKHRYGQASMF